MTTLHLLPSSGHQTAATLKQNFLAMLAAYAQELTGAVHRLDPAWQGRARRLNPETPDLLPLVRPR